MQFNPHYTFDTFRQLEKYYSKHEIIMIDDIDALVKRPAAQEEVIYLVDILYRKKRQIIITSELLPLKLSVINRCLLRHYDHGIMVDISAPKNFCSRKMK